MKKIILTESQFKNIIHLSLINKSNSFNSNNVIFDKKYCFSDGFAKVKLNGKWSFIDKQNNLIGHGNLWFDEANNFSDGYAAVQLDGKWSFIDIDTHLIIKDEDNNELWFDEANNFEDGYAAVQLNGKWSFIDADTGKLVENSNLWFDEANNFSDGYAAVQLNGKWSFMDSDTGKLINNGNLWFDEANNFEDGYAKIEIKGNDYYLREDLVLCDYNTKEPINIIKDNIDEGIAKKIGTAALATALSVAPLHAKNHSTTTNNDPYYQDTPSKFDSKNNTANDILFNSMASYSMIDKKVIDKIRKSEGGDVCILGLMQFVKYINYYNNQYYLNKDKIGKQSKNDYIVSKIRDNVTNKIMFTYRFDDDFNENMLINYIVDVVQHVGALEFNNMLTNNSNITTLEI